MLFETGKVDLNAVVSTVCSTVAQIAFQLSRKFLDVCVFGAELSTQALHFFLEGDDLFFVGTKAFLGVGQFAFEIDDEVFLLG